jgi:pimeloyl-ACP methyl ester carboxylesterase
VGRAVTGKIPGARFEYLPGVGHFPFLEAPARTSQLITDFVQAGRDPRGE